MALWADGKASPARRKPRKGSQKVHVTVALRAKVEALARQAGLPISAFLALGIPTILTLKNFGRSMTTRTAAKRRSVVGLAPTTSRSWALKRARRERQSPASSAPI